LEKTTTATNHQQKATPTVVVVFVALQVPGEVVNPLR